MAISFGSNFTTTAGTGAGPHTGSFDLDNDTIAIVICVSVHANNEAESVITAVTFGGVSATESIQDYQAGSDGGMSIWYLNSPNTSGSQTLSITQTDSVWGIKASVTEIMGGGIEEDSTASEDNSTGDPNVTINIQNADALMFGVMSTYQANDTKISPTGIFLKDWGDAHGGVQRQVAGGTGNKSIYWNDVDEDEYWQVVGAAYTVTTPSPDLPSTSDSISVSEYVAGSVSIIILYPSANDNVSVSEYVKAAPPPLTLSVDDSVSIAEDVDSHYIKIRNAQTSDAVSVTESVDVRDITNPSVSDGISVSENIELIGGASPEPSESVSVTEVIRASVYPIDINVSDSTSITEWVSEWSHVPIPAVVDDSTHLSENVALQVYNPPISPRYTGIAVKYNVRLKNHNGIVTAVFDNFARLEYETRVNDVGYFSITFFNNNDVRFSQFFLDAQVEIWRSVPGQGVDYYKVFEGFFRKVNKTIAETGERLVTFSGVSYNDLLARTIIAYKAGTIRADKDAPVETVMKEYVEENCGVTADDTVVGRLYQGYLPNFSVEPTSHGGPNWEGSRAFENLLDVLTDIGQQTAVDFNVVGSGPAEFEFKTYVNQMGKDHRSYDLDTRGRNPAGNLPVVFSTDFGFASDFSYVYDRMAEGNVVVVLGEGEGSTQTTITRSNEEAVVASPWNRCEVSRPGTSQEYEYQLNQLGDEVLEELKAQQFIEFTPLQQAAQMYGVHYDIGDRITAKSEDVKTHSKIVVIHTTFEQDAEQVELELSDVPTPT